MWPQNLLKNMTTSTAQSVNWIVESRAHNYELMSRPDFNPDEIIVDQPVFDRMIELFGAYNLKNDGTSTLSIAHYLIRKVIAAFNVVQPTNYLPNRMNSGHLWVMPRKIEPLVGAYVDYLIQEKLASGDWDNILQRLGR